MKMQQFCFSKNIDNLELVLDDLWLKGCSAIQENENEVIAFFNEKIDLGITGEWQDVDNKDYIAEYYDKLEPIHLKRLVIVPTHRSVKLSSPKRVLWLDPGMAFGSGHHETTRMALENLEAHDLRSKIVLDLGSGSGILAIAAELLAAERVLGIDIDPLTIPVAEQNNILNSTKANFSLASIDSIQDNFADLIVANIYAEIHEMLIDEYVRVLKADGSLIITGIMLSKLANLQEIFAQKFKTQSRTTGEWALIEAKL